MNHFPAQSCGLRRALLAAASALMIAGCGGGGSGPAAPVAGDVVNVSMLNSPTGVEQAGATRKLRYLMTGVDGGLTQANALLFLPRGTAPAGGWPLTVWAHGTTGVSDGCAPSRDYAQLGDSDVVAPLLAAGFAVLAPDYEGLDAPGVHPYLVRDSLGHSIVDAVKAAQGLGEVSLSKRWAVLGHSEGGFAALAAAQFAGELGAGRELRAVVALAPASDLAQLTDLNFAALDSLTAAGEADSAAHVVLALNYYGGMIAQGFRAVLPGVAPEAMFGSRVSPFLAKAESDSDCNQYGMALTQDFQSFVIAGGDMRAYAGVKRDWHQNAPVRDFLARNRVGQMRLRAPVFVAQGLADLEVHPAATATLVETLRANGNQVTSVTVPDADHQAVVAAQLAASIAFVRERMAAP
ncbi:MAG: prolyl oligopeptidase family serine peptidase [Burkholderiaceae bacterium]|nr:prolyl oligopeptidase family serine peptidase [Burkholderiaceae bacterium]MBT9500671.1 prolyl oligopeptidase family serine peptidase [Burkholderiaceae bacterium]